MDEARLFVRHAFLYGALFGRGGENPALTRERPAVRVLRTRQPRRTTAYHPWLHCSPTAAHRGTPPAPPPPDVCCTAAHRLCPNYVSPGAFPPACHPPHRRTARGRASAPAPAAVQTLSPPAVHADKPHSRSTALRERIRNAREGVTGREK